MLGFARRGSSKTERLSAWLAVAAALHLAGFFWAARIEPRPPRATAGECSLSSMDLTTEATAALLEAPKPSPATPPRLAEAPASSPQTVTGPPVPRAPAPRPAPTTAGVKDRLEAHFASALAAVAVEASRILTSTEGQGPPMASGNAASTYGMVAGDGTGTSPTFDARAGLRGRGGGSGAPVDDPPGPDRSRGAGVQMGFNEDCDFPEEADHDKIDHGWAQLIVTVSPDGSAVQVKVLAESGHGFGRMAQVCALRAVYDPALDRAGRPIQQDTPSFRYRFTR